MTYPFLEQFEKYVMPVTESGCWLWLGYVSENGYGRFSPRWKMAPLYAHRISYEIHKGQIPEGLVVDHLCRVRCCVNPDHLEVVSQHKNLQRGNGTSKINHQFKTHCKRGHEFTNGSFYLRGRTRICLICDRARNKEKYRRSKNDRP